MSVPRFLAGHLLVDPTVPRIDEEEDKPKPDVEFVSASTVPGEGDAVGRPPLASVGVSNVGGLWVSRRR